jgi:molybdopterin molybdotransferase
MITVEEAKSILIQSTFKLNKTGKRKIKDSTGFFLAEEIYSPVDLPQFNQSNVDGYAVRFSDSNQWKVIDEIKAGDDSRLKLKKGEAARIFTGAVVPEGADCIIMQENIRVRKNIISVDETKFSSLTAGTFIRSRGSQIKKGEHALSKNIYITPAATGFLSAMGMDEVKIFKKPKVSIIITGNEIESPGKKLKHGKVYDSNSFILKSALLQMNLKPDNLIFLKDDKIKLKKIISLYLNKSDVILISGGISVGKFDFVNEVLDKLGTIELFYKVLQRPGKPLYFGKKDNTFIFGLPGNPSSVLTCFYEYAYPLLKKMQGYENYFLNSTRIPVQKDLNKNFKLSNFLKAKINDGGVMPLEGQASYILKSFAEADCFIYLPVETEFVRAGEEVEVHLFP